MVQNIWSLSLVVLVAALTFLLGYVGSRRANTTPDFLVARRAIPATRNAAAISGEYLSAASFLGVAGLVLKDGIDALWYPIGFTAGYLAMMLFVAAPLRRSGAYTLPDFAEARLGSRELRHVCTFFVVCIGVLYLVPQLQSAGLTLNTITGLPVWLGGVVVAVIVVVNVLGGGMRAITLVQAFQYWGKLFAVAAPTFVLFAVFLAGPGNGAQDVDDQGVLRFHQDTTITTTEPVRVRAVLPMELEVVGQVNGALANGPVYWTPRVYEVGARAELRFRAGDPVPVVEGSPASNAQWLDPRGRGLSGLLETYSLIFATFLGTMGLPHVLVRFYTNPDGRAARRTALHVLYLLGLFYLFPTVLGVISRQYLPELLVTGKTDAAVLLLPHMMVPSLGGKILGAIVAAGAFAAFLSTSSGLVVSVAGVVSTDILPGKVRDFRWATLLTGAVAIGLALLLPRGDASLTVVAMSFTLAASTFCPLLLLGIWWRGLTWVGAMAGLIVGGGLVIGSQVLTVISSYTGDWAPPITAQPALLTVPAAFATMVVISKLTARRSPEDVNQILLRLHAPDPLGFMRDRDVQRFGSGEKADA